MNFVHIILAALALAAIGWPRYGVLARWRTAQELARRTRREDALKHILKCEADARPATLESVAGAVHLTIGDAARLLEELEARDLLTFSGGHLRLRSKGREMGLHIVRAHRLWESYLAEYTGVAEDQWHVQAEKQEHLLTPEETRVLAARLGHPVCDPHGDIIPDSVRALIEDQSESLNGIDVETPVVITHLEDEPVTVYRQLVAEGLRPGMQAFVTERSDTRIRFWADGNEHVLAPVLAENVSVKRLPEFRQPELVEEELLAGLRPGERARVVGLSPACRGADRRRLLDLGFVPGTTVEVDMISPAGDPTAYRVRGSVIALRREQANLIRIHTQEAVAS